MKKRILIMAVLLLTVVQSMGQVIVVSSRKDGGGGGMSNRLLAEQKTIGEATLECVYDFQYFEDPFIGENTEENTRKNDVMVLQTGNGISKFYSYQSARLDSLMRRGMTAEEIMANASKLRGGASWILFKNYPKGKLTLTDKVWQDHFLYEEEMPVLEWEIGDETKEIEGYVCQKAECDFRGRHWTVWFSPEVPVSEGPWKLGGLPGLIMQAADADEQFVFTLTGLRQTEPLPVTITEIQYLKSNRKNYLKVLRKYKEDPVGMISRSGAEVVMYNSDGTRSDREATAPKEMKYDFLETDYR